MLIRTSYKINPSTIAVLPEFKVNGTKAFVIEENTQFYVNQTPAKIAEVSLLHYGSNLNGAKKSSQYYLGLVRRPPIMICSKLEIFFYTTAAIKKYDTIWLSASHTKHIKKVNSEKTNIQFSNGNSIEIEGKFKSIQTYYHRCLELKKIQLEAIQNSKMEKSFNQEKQNPVLFVKDPQSISYSISKTSKNT